MGKRSEGKGKLEHATGAYRLGQKKIMVFRFYPQIFEYRV